MACLPRGVWLSFVRGCADMSFGADLTACASLVQRADPERFAAVMASPLPARKILFPLYAFNVEVSRAPWLTQEPMIAEMRLQWWRDALEEISNGDTVRRHEVMTPLSAFLDAESAQVLDRLVAARRWDIYKDPFEDEAHFDRYLAETAGGLMWVAARALATNDTDIAQIETAETQVRGIGQATGLARFLQAVPALEDAKRIPLVDGRASAIAERAGHALSTFGTDVAIKRKLARPMRPALCEAYQTKAILSQAAQNPHRVGDGTLGISPLRRSMLLWRWS